MIAYFLLAIVALMALFGLAIIAAFAIYIVRWKNDTWGGLHR